jgi:hypothetical protein
VNMRMHDDQGNDTNSVDIFEDSRTLKNQSFEKFENEFYTFLSENEVYEKFYFNVIFYEKNAANKRMCSFCYVKKVI